MLRPLFARVLLERERIKTTLIIPQIAERRNAPTQGKVIARGPTADESIPIGATVLFGKFAGDWLKDGDSEVYVCQDEDIIAVVEHG